MITTIRSTIKNSLTYSLGTFSSKLIGVFLIPLYVSSLEVSEYGMLGILDITAQLLIAIFGISLFQSLFRWYWEQKQPKYQKSLFFTILSSVTLFSISFGFLVLLFQKQVSILIFDSESFTLLIRLLIFTSILEAINIVTLTLLRIQEKSLFYSLLSVSKFSFQLIFTIYFIVFRGMKIEGIYYAQIIGNLIMFTVSLKFILRNVHWHFLGNIFIQLLKYSVPILFSSIVYIVYTVTDRYMLRFLSDYNVVGIYTLGFKVANVLKVVVVNSVNLALFPIIFKMINHKNSKRFYSKIMTYYSFGLMLFILGLSFFSKEIVILLSRNNKEYWEAYNLIPIISFSILFGMLRDISMTGLNITKKTYIVSVITFIVIFINVLLNYITIPLIGYFGAALSTLFSQIISVFLILRFAQKHYFIPFEFKKVLIIFILGIIFIFLSLLLNSLNSYFQIALKVLLLVSFPFILYPLHFYEKIELERIKEIWGTWKNPRKWKYNLRRISENNSEMPEKKI